MSNEILTALKNTHLDATYDGETAKAYWQDSSGEYWSNSGYQTFTDENSSVNTIEWGKPVPHLDDLEEAKQAMVA